MHILLSHTNISQEHLNPSSIPFEKDINYDLSDPMDKALHVLSSCLSYPNIPGSNPAENKNCFEADSAEAGLWESCLWLKEYWWFLMSVYIGFSPPTSTDKGSYSHYQAKPSPLYWPQ